MTFNWTFVIDLGIISTALLIATFIRNRVQFFQKFLIPNSLTAGFILLPFYNFVAPLIGINTMGLGNLVYHLLSLSFISMTLRMTPPRKSGKGVLATANSTLIQYSIQCFLGLGITLIFIATILPNLFPGFGLCLTLGYCLGPGQGFAIGTGWEKFGFIGGGSVGLTFGAMGFIWACFIGIFLVNHGIRKGWISRKEIEASKKASQQKDDSTNKKETKFGFKVPPEIMDPMTYNLGYVLGVYLLTFLLLTFISFLLSFAGKLGNDLGTNLWGISFIFAALMAMLVKRILQKFKIDHTINNDNLNRIAGISVDFMVAAAIGAISIVVVTQYWIPILILGIVGVAVSSITHIWMSSRLFKDYVFYRTILVYGAITGTLPTGLALLRIIDPEFKTPAATDYMYAAAVVFVFAIPLILSMNLPAYGYTSGKSYYSLITLGIYAFYVIFNIIAYKVLAGKAAFQQPGKLWYKG